MDDQMPDAVHDGAEKAAEQARRTDGSVAEADQDPDPRRVKDALEEVEHAFEVDPLASRGADGGLDRGGTSADDGTDGGPDADGDTDGGKDTDGHRPVANLE